MRHDINSVDSCSDIERENQRQWVHYKCSRLLLDCCLSRYNLSMTDNIEESLGAKRVPYEYLMKYSLTLSLGVKHFPEI